MKNNGGSAIFPKDFIMKVNVTRMPYSDPHLINAFLAGVDYAKNGPDTKNCNFGFFSTKELMAAWSKGSKLKLAAREGKDG